MSKAKANFQKLYEEKIISSLQEKFSYNNKMIVPKLEKIILNIGAGDGVANNKSVDEAAADLALISGQKPVITRAKKSIAGFKLRQNLPIGCKVTLRGRRMYEFAERLVNIAMPRIRDFRGLLRSSFDGNGNFAMGIKEQIIFPEIDYDKVNKIRGLDVVIVTTADTKDESLFLLEGFGFPFKK